MKAQRLITLGLFGLTALYGAATPASDYIYPSGSGVALNTKLLVHTTGYAKDFSAPLTLTAKGQVIAGKTEFSDSWIVFTPAQALQPNTSYTITVVYSTFTPSVATFITGTATDTTPPQMVSSSPANLEDSPGFNKPVQLKFSKPLNPVSLASAAPRIVNLSSNAVYSSTVSLLDATTVSLFFNYYTTLPAGRVFRVYFPGALPSDLCGNAGVPPGPDFVFTSYPVAPKDGAKLSGSVPANAETGVPTNTAITLSFDRPVILPTDGGLTLSSDGEASVALKVEAVESRNALILRPQVLLRGNRRYTLSVNALYDQWGGHMATGPLLVFTTGTLPELSTFSRVLAPAASMPKVSKLRWVYSRAINPYLLPRLRRSGTGTDMPVQLLDDGVTMEAEISDAGSYILGSAVYDRAESKPLTDYSSFTVGTTPDDRAPSVVAIFPPDQATGIQPAAVPAVQFDETIEMPRAGQIHLWQATNEVAATISMSGLVVRIQPEAILTPGLDYRVEVRAPRDLAGNTGADVVWSFHVDSAKPTDAFRVDARSPDVNATGVARDTQIVATFNRTPNPLSLTSSGCSSVSGSFGTVTGRWRVEDVRAIFQPDEPLPPGAHVSWNLCNVTDLFGQGLSSTSSYGAFWTEESADAAPALRITGMTPADGETIPSGAIAVTLQFNQPVIYSTLFLNTILFRNANGVVMDMTTSYNSATRQVQLSTSSLPAGEYTLTATADVRSQSGARLEPFMGRVTVGAAAESSSNGTQSLIRSAFIPSNGNYAIDDPPVVVHFWTPMDRTLVEQGLRVVASNTVLSGRVEWTPDSASLTFFPKSPLPASTSGFVLLSLAPWGRAGAESVMVTTGGTTPTGSAVRWNLGQGLPSDGVIEIEFNQDVPADYVKSATVRSLDSRSGLPDGKTVILPAVSRRTPRIFRMTAPEPYALKLYSIELSTSDGGTQSVRFGPADYSTPTSRRIETGPVDEAGKVPLNSVIWLETHTVLNPFTVNPRVTLDGEPVRIVPEISDNGMLVLLRPVGLLRGNSVYTVEFKGLEDMAGHALPDCAWTFHTGPGADFKPAELVSWSPKGTGGSTSTLRVQFNKPVFFHRITTASTAPAPYDFLLNIGSTVVQGSIEASSDGRMLSFVPQRPWPVDTTISVPLSYSYVLDWTGSAVTGTGAPSYYLLSAGFTSSAPSGTPPVVETRSPAVDATQVPRNVRIQAKFERAVLESSLAGITLSSADGTVPIQTLLASDSRTLTVVPNQMLEANRQYTVSLAGILSTDGTAREEAIEWSFTTTENVAGIPSLPVIVPSQSDPLSFRVLFARPLNPCSVDSSDVVVTLNSTRRAVTWSIEDGGAALRITPSGQPPAGGTWSLSVSGLTDWAELPFPASALLWQTSAATDAEAPTAVSLLPAPDSTVAWNVSAVAMFNKPVSMRMGAAGVRVSSGGVEVPVKAQMLAATTLSISPILNWHPGATYQVEVTGMVDASGNEAAPVSWSFSIASDGVSDSTYLKLVSVSPGSGSVGVAVDAPLVLEFSRPVLLSSSYSSRVTIYPTPTIAPKVTFDQNRVRIEPSPAWKPGTQYSFSGRFSDIFGQSWSANISFTTAASEDREPPQVESVTPAPGSQLPAGMNEFLVRFNEPVSPGYYSVRFSANGSSHSSVQVSQPAAGDGRTIVTSFTLPSSTTGTLDLSADITDLSGNALKPVSFEYTVGATGDEYQAMVKSIQPPVSVGALPLDAVITLQFNLPMDETSLRNAIRVSDDGYQVPVTLASDDTNQVWTITPASPWLPATTVVIAVDSSAFSTSGLYLLERYSVSYRTAATPATSASSPVLAAVRTSSMYTDLRFAEPLAAPPAEPFGLRDGSTRIEATVERMGPAWYRLTPGTPLSPGAEYTLMAGPGVEIRLRIPAESGTGESGNPVVNREGSSRLVLHFSAPVHAFSVNAATLVLLDPDGNEVPHEARLSIDGRTVIVEPMGARPARELLWQGRRISIE